MKKLTLAVLAGMTLIASAVARQEAADPNAAEAKAIVKEFFTTLMGELQAAIKEGGPVNGVVVCQSKAPAIAQELSENTGWEVGRTSLKLRNAALNKADEWELQVLERFEARKAAGEDVETMTYSEVVSEDGKQVYRFMKAIPTGELCLNCHGSELKPQVAAALDQAYPQDQARGFELGDIRGAFTLSKPL
jgi:hypothetical protein